MKETTKMKDGEETKKKKDERNDTDSDNDFLADLLNATPPTYATLPRKKAHS